MKRNPHLANLQSGYLFPEVARRVLEYRKSHPQADLISLSVGDTTEPLPLKVSQSLASYATQLGTLEGYSGYGPWNGSLALRQRIAQRLYNHLIDPEEITISDGAKSDLGRLQLLFGPNATVAIQDPSYPAYVDSCVIVGQARSSCEGRYSRLVYLSCTPENGFFPSLKELPTTDLIYLCSPNNPTGAVATKEQLTELVRLAQKNRSLIIFDSAYAFYIQDRTLPRSIFEIEGARNVAIEVSSFSKLCGFTGVRLGWTIIPKELTYEEGSSVSKDWNRLLSTVFNGASNLAQAGGLACLDDSGWNQCQETIHFYLENAKLVRSALQSLSLCVYGGENAPYLWVKFPRGSSWELFDRLLHEAHLITTPGVGFGPCGEGFLRFSAFGHRNRIHEACERLKKWTL